MFKTNPDGMRMEPTPERVLAVCKLIARKSMTRDEVRFEMTLGNKEEKTLDQIDKSIRVALEDLAILQAIDDKLELAVDSQVVSDYISFRRYVSSKVFSRKDTTFYIFTNWVISQNDRIFAMKSWEGMAKTCGAEVKELSELNENGVLGWRFWAAFLGIGYLSGTMIIPNMKLRVHDVLATKYSERFEYNVPIRANIFLQWLVAKLPEVTIAGALPLALSAAFRTLHELDLIKLETWRDSDRVPLFYVDGEPINEFSHISVKEAITK